LARWNFRELKYYGIQTHTLNWIQAFLTDITQSVVVGGVTSNTVLVTSGVPQGTLLEPILFSNLHQWLSGISYTQQTKTLCRWQYNL
jgi:hypothetical protein